MMCELPVQRGASPTQFLDHFDGFSIGSNDMTQLTLGLDRDSALVAAGFDERDPAVQVHARAAPSRPARRAASTSASAARAPATTPTSPSGCSSRASSRMSLNPDTVVETWIRLGGLKAKG